MCRDLLGVISGYKQKYDELKIKYDAVGECPANLEELQDRYDRLRINYDAIVIYKEKYEQLKPLYDELLLNKQMYEKMKAERDVEMYGLASGAIIL